MDNVTSVFLNLVRSVLWPNTGFILEDVPCVLEKVLVWDGMFCISVKCTRHKVLRTFPY